MPHWLHNWNVRQSERGQVLIIAVLGMVALLGFVSLAIDVGRMTITRRQLQNAADAAAHAGAQVLPGSPSYARSDAAAWAERNGISGADGLAISIRSTNTANDTIDVEVSRNVPFTFGRVLKLYDATITANASATVASVTGSIGVMPFGLVDLNGVNTEGFGYTFGQEVTLKEAPSNHFGPGNYGFLALDDKGGKSLKDTISNGGSQTLLKVGDTVPTEPGQKTGPVTQGLDAWADDNNDAMGSACDDWDAAHKYVNGKLQITAKCKYRVILIPIIDYWPNGRKDVTILGFAQMYLKGWDPDNDKAIDAVFLDDTYAHPGIVAGVANDYGTRIVRILDYTKP
jgi:hypothetical protein